MHSHAERGNEGMCHRFFGCFACPAMRQPSWLTRFLPEFDRDHGDSAMKRHLLGLVCLALLGTKSLGQEDFKILDKASQTPLQGTQPLTLEGDLASQMVAGVDKFLLREIDKSVERRARH